MKSLTGVLKNCPLASFVLLLLLAAKTSAIKLNKLAPVADSFVSSVKDITDFKSLNGTLVPWKGKIKIQPTEGNWAQFKPRGSKVCTTTITVPKFLTDKQRLDFLLISVLVITSLAAFVLLFLNKKIVGCFLPEEETDFAITEDNLDIVLTYPQVRALLFDNADSYFKVKYGQCFELENYDNFLIKSEVLDLANSNLCNLKILEKGEPRIDVGELTYSLKEKVKERREFENSMQRLVFSNLLDLFSLTVLLGSTCYLLKCLDYTHNQISLAVVAFIVLATITTIIQNIKANSNSSEDS